MNLSRPLALSFTQLSPSPITSCSCLLQVKMESKTMSSILRLVCILVFLTGFTTSDIDKDKEKCANQVAGLVTCLPYVSGEAKAPPKECCTGLKQVIQTSPECICLLVKDKDDPSLGLKINATLALSLPSQCQAPANISDCPRLLHLPPNSPDAKVFDDFANSANKTNSAPAPAASGSTSSATATTTDQKSDGTGRSKRFLGFEMASGLLLTVVVSILYVA